MKVGEIITIKYIVKERECEECEKPAQHKHTYLLIGSRANPRSSTYGKDDCSWCEDDYRYACEEHKEKIRRDCPSGTTWCSTFTRNRGFEHMFIYKEKIEDSSEVNK